MIDLKTKKITHQDVGQMDMYIWMYNERKKHRDDNPTFGIVLCADTDEDIAKYSVMYGKSSCLPANTPDYQAAIDEEKVAQRLALLNNIDEVIL